MELILRLSSGLPREIVSEAFFRIRPPTEWDHIGRIALGQTLILEECLFHGLVDAPILNNLLISPAKKGHSRIVSLLLAEGADPSFLNHLALWEAAQEGHEEVVSLLLEASPNHSAMIIAALNGHVGVVSRFLSAGADPSLRDNAALRCAATNGHIKVVSLLLDHGADPSARGDYALSIAEKGGYDDLADLLRRKHRRID